MISSILGFSAFGLAARFGQLGIQKRNLFENLGGHALAAALFGYGGYLAYKWDVRSGELLQDRRREIEERRAARAEAASE